MVRDSDATPPQVQIEPLESHLQIDGDMVKAHAKVVYQVAEEFKNPLDPVQPESSLCVKVSQSLAPKQKSETLPPSFPVVTLHDLGPVAS